MATSNVNMNGAPIVNGGGCASFASAFSQNRKILPYRRSSYRENGSTVGVWVSEYGEYSMRGRRSDMEDAHCIAQNARYVFLSIFDGHDGKDVSEFVAKYMWQYFLDSPYHTVAEKLQNAADRCERMMLLEKKQAGCAAAVVVFDKEDGVLHAWNLGDCEIMLLPDTSDKYEILSEMHRGDNPSERQRIERMVKGSQLIQMARNKINGQMETRVNGYGVSRAFGDFQHGKVRVYRWVLFSPIIINRN
jgi:serine/threonine protein phosphatase PrpC